MRVKLACCILLCCLTGAGAIGQENASGERRPTADTARRQLRLAFDISKPVLNAILENRTSYELGADYYLGRELYAVLEGGWGSARFQYPDLRYTSRNSFVRVGADRSLLVRLLPNDWDMALFGFRYAFAPVNRGEATFTTKDTVWGSTSGIVPGVTKRMHWGEITAGVRVELRKLLFVGWNVRGKFLLNQNAFQDLRPSFVAGYGQGDRNTVFDFNIWVAYGLRW